METSAAEVKLYSGIDAITEEPIEITVRSDTIDEVRPIHYDSNLPYLSPGLFDIQVNGFRGVDYGYGELSVDDVLEVVRLLASAGITRHIATFVTNSNKSILGKMEVLREAVGRYGILREALQGVHLEGPFLSPEDGPRGAHDSLFLRDPDIGLLNEWHQASGGLLQIVTIAPELKGAVSFIEKARELGVVCAIGHTAAEPDDIRAAVEAGALLSTHLGNGSHALLPRLRNYVWEQLAEDRLWASIICDGFHLPSSVVKVMARAKGMDKLILIGDTTAVAGNTPGRYSWGNIETEVCADGHVVLSGTPYLAGSGHLFDWDIQRFIEYTGASLSETLTLCNDNPSELLGIERNNLKAGHPANFFLFRMLPDSERLRVEKTIIHGNEIYRSNEAIAKQ
jgi:N-acetylglucosamine-6-phosphate deacetylase